MATGIEQWRKERAFEMLERIASGDTAKMLAHDYGLTVGSVYRILTKYRRVYAARKKKPGRGR